MPQEVDAELVRVLGALAKVVVLSFLMERALALVFEWRWYEERLQGKGFKGPIAALSSAYVCWYYDMDVLAALFKPKSVTLVGVLVTGFVVAGGSAAALQLFQDVFGFSKTARGTIKKTRELEALAAQKAAQVKIAEADAKLLGVGAVTDASAVSRRVEGMPAKQSHLG